MKHSNSRCRLSRMVIFAPVLVWIGIGLTAPSAGAVPLDGDYLVSGAKIYHDANGGSAVIGLGYPGHGVTLLCGEYGPWALNSTTINYWIRHSDNTTGKLGYTAGSNVGPWTWNTLPQCPE